MLPTTQQKNMLQSKLKALVYDTHHNSLLFTSNKQHKNKGNILLTQAFVPWLYVGRSYNVMSCKLHSTWCIVGFKHWGSEALYGSTPVVFMAKQENTGRLAIPGKLYCVCMPYHSAILDLISFAESYTYIPFLCCLISQETLNF